jgi:hypothetical protein
MHWESVVMLRNSNEIIGYTLQATDGDIGCCEDFLFDDQFWIVRYMLANTNTWLPGAKKTLISPNSVGDPDRETKHLPISLSRELIKNSPLLDEHKPVSREYEANFFDYYGYGYYWMGAEQWRSYTDPIASAKLSAEVSIADSEEINDALSIEEGHLRSAKEVQGYSIKSLDGDIGHVDGFILNDVNWTIEYLIIDTKNWLSSSRKVLISPNWLSSVNWVERSVRVGLTSEQIINSPEFDVNKSINPDIENLLRNFYDELTKQLKSKKD